VSDKEQNMDDVKQALPTDATERKAIPLARGVLDYFPAALAEVARLSAKGNEQHNPGEEMHWARGKSNDHADCILRHLADRGTVDTDGQRHSAKVAWRALALLQLELEAAGAPTARGARVAEAVQEAPVPVPDPEERRCLTCASTAPGLEGLHRPPCNTCGPYRNWTPAHWLPSARTCTTCYHRGSAWPCSACSKGPERTGTDLWQAEEE
jgi:hypothetical protein